MNRLENIKNNDMITCPVCNQEVMMYDICDNCGWQNTGTKNTDGGPNKMTLTEAIKAYKIGLKVK